MGMHSLTALLTGGILAVAVCAEAADGPPPPGELLRFTFAASAVYPGTTRDYAVYVPAQYDGRTPACVHVHQDGMQYGGQAVFDRLIHEGKMPVTIGVFVNPGRVPATRQGAVVISAAGNDSIDLDHNQDEVVLPAESGNGMAVSATGPVDQANFDNPASYTNYGKSAIDVAAPGGDAQLYPADGWWLDMVLSTVPGGWAWASGTSMAAPHVAGVAALVIESNGGEMHPAQVKAAIEQSAEDLGKRSTDAYYGRGRINAYSAVND